MKNLLTLISLLTLTSISEAQTNKLSLSGKTLYCIKRIDKNNDRDNDNSFYKGTSYLFKIVFQNNGRFQFFDINNTLAQGSGKFEFSDKQITLLYDKEPKKEYVIVNKLWPYITLKRASITFYCILIEFQKLI